MTHSRSCHFERSEAESRNLPAQCLISVIPSSGSFPQAGIYYRLSHTLRVPRFFAGAQNDTQGGKGDAKRHLYSSPPKGWQRNWIRRGAKRPENPVTCFPVEKRLTTFCASLCSYKMCSLCTAPLRGPPIGGQENDRVSYLCSAPYTLSRFAGLPLKGKREI